MGYRAEFITLAGSTQRGWVGTIDIVKASGADVSAEDFEFRNWDAMRNYTADMYESR